MEMRRLRAFGAAKIMAVAAAAPGKLAVEEASILEPVEMDIYLTLREVLHIMEAVEGRWVQREGQEAAERGAPVEGTEVALGRIRE